MPRNKKQFGLNSIFPTPDTATAAALSNAFPEVEEAVKSVVEDIGRTYRNVPIEQITPNPFQPRKKFDQQSLQELADSLNAEGMLEPIILRVSPSQPGRYEIAAGERRWRAAKMAGWDTCPAEVMESCPDARMKRIALLENIQREQLTPLELAEIYDALLREKDVNGQAVYTVRSLAEMLKKNKDHIDEHRALLRVPPDVRQLIEDDPAIPVRVIRELGNIDDAVDRAYLIEEVKARNLKTADVIAILQQRKKMFQEAILTQNARGASTPRSPLSGQSEQVSSRMTSVPEQRPSALPSAQDAVTVIEHERALHKPSSALSLAVLERKLQKDQTQLEKTVGRIVDELPAMGEEEKAMVRKYLEQWRERIDQVVNILSSSEL